MANLSATDLAGQRIRQFRQRRGWTARELAGRCAGVGAPHITATVITNLETRRRPSRQITLDELLVLAYVLDVPPIRLFLPLSDGERLEITPAVTKEAVPSVLWLSGLLGSPDWPDTADAERHRRWQDLNLQAVLPIEALLEVWAWVTMYRWMADRLYRDDFPDPMSRAAAEQGMGDMPHRIGKAIDLMLAYGLTPPRLPRGLVEDLKIHGVLTYPDKVPVLDEDDETPDWLADPEAALGVVDFARRLTGQIIRYGRQADEAGGSAGGGQPAGSRTRRRPRREGGPGDGEG